MSPRRFPSALVFFGFLFFAAASAQADIKVFITTDVHGHAAEEAAKGRLGYAKLKALADRAARAGHTVFLMDSGDAFSGAALAQFDHGRSLAELVGLMGYRVLTPGNHAFDYNEIEANPLYYSEVLLATARAKAGGPLDVVAGNLSLKGRSLPGLSGAPVIIYDETAEDPDGLRLIVAGVLTPQASRANLRAAGYDFGLKDSPAETRAAVSAGLAEALKDFNRPRDVVIVLSHVGWFGPEGDREGRLGGPDAAVANVDFIADGHTHQAVAPRRIGGAVYANGGRYLENFLEITVDGDGRGRMELKGYEDAAGLEPDRRIAEKTAEMERRLGLSEVVFESPDAELFSDRRLYDDNVALGRLICSAMMRAAGAELAFHNLGGLRDGLPGGPVRARDLLDVLPFDDELVVLSLTGREIQEELERGSGRGGNHWPQFYGFKVYAWRDGEGALGEGALKAAGLRKTDGSPLEPDREYRTALNGFMARRLGRAVEKRGDLFTAVRNELASGVDSRALREPALLVFPGRAEALAAWEKAGPRR